MQQGAVIQSATPPVCNINNYKDYIKNPGNHKCNLSGANLSGKSGNLRNANLSGANFAGAILVATDFRGANLSYANLSGANLQGANFAGADLTCVDFSNADLIRAVLTDVNLSGANFSGATFHKTRVDPEGETYLTSKGISGFVVENE